MRVAAMALTLLLAVPAAADPPLHLIDTAPCSFAESAAESFLFGSLLLSDVDPCTGSDCATRVDIVDSSATASNLIVQSPPVPSLPDRVGYELSTGAISSAFLPSFVSNDTFADADGIGQACLAVTALEPMWLDFEWEMGASNDGSAGSVTESTTEITKNGLVEIARTIESFGTLVLDDEFGFEVEMDPGDVVLITTASFSDSVAFVGSWSGVAFTDVLVVVPEPGAAPCVVAGILALAAMARARRVAV